MIAYIEGKPKELKANYVILFTNGLGYYIKISLNTYSSIVEDSVIGLHTHTYVREDRIELYGFAEKNERSLFEELIRINGVGPNVALSILSGMTVQDVYDAVRQKDSASFVKVPGIGRTKAEKILLDLQNRKHLFEYDESSPSSGIVNDAIESMVALGFDEKQASKAVYDVYNMDKEVELESLLRKTLSQIKK